MEKQEILQYLLNGARYAVYGLAVIVVVFGLLNIQTATDLVNERYHKELSENYLCFYKPNYIADYNPGTDSADINYMWINTSGV